MFKKKKEVVVPLPILPKRWEASEANRKSEVNRLINAVRALENIYALIDRTVMLGGNWVCLYRKYDNGEVRFNSFDTNGLLDLDYIESDLASLGYTIEQDKRDEVQYILTWGDAK